MNYGFILKGVILSKEDKDVIESRVKARIELEKQEVLNPFEHFANLDTWVMTKDAKMLYPSFPVYGTYDSKAQAEIALGLYKATPTKTWDYQELYKLSKFISNGLLSL
jgi:hypothetical protein